MQAISNAITYCFGVLFSLIATVFNGVWYVLRRFLTAIFTLPPWVWKAFSFLSWACATVVAATITVLGLIGTAIHRCVDLLGAVHHDGATSQLPHLANTLLASANTFSPLEEIFACITVLSATYAAAVIVRTIKAWLPMIGGTGFTS